MKYNKLVKLLLLILVVIMMMGVVSAVDSDAVETSENLVVEQESVSETESVESDILSDGNAGNSWYIKAGSTGGDGSEDKPYGNLKAVTGNANYKENDVIYVMDGTYTGTSNTGTGIILKENTTLVAYNGAKPIFDGQNARTIFKVTNDGVMLKGLTFMHGYGVVDSIGGRNTYCAGLIYNSGNNFVVDNCTFKDTNDVNYGAGIYSKGSNTEIKNSHFENNEAAYGGAIAINGPYAKIINNVFSENSGYMGGAINIYDYGVATIVNNTFNRNRANMMSGSGYGGAIYGRAGNNILANNTFNRNSAVSYGGAMALVNGFNTIDNCTFDSNQIFDSNTNTNWGGAIYIQGTNNTLKNSHFINNAVRDNGGALYIRNSNNTIENCTFDKNWAARGGAIYLAEIVAEHNITDNVINNCTFNENGVKDSKGGAIYSWSYNTTVTNSNFNKNVALQGGAILYEKGPNFLENNTFIGNNATRYGGGAITSARYGDRINNCTFIDNHAQGYGGAVSLDYPTITNSLFIGNHGNHGGAICTIEAHVSDSEFYNNTADDDWVVLAATKLVAFNNIHPGQVALSMNHTNYLNITYDTKNLIAYMDGYYAYCAEEYADYAQYGVLWENLRFVQNSLTEERVGEYLKILILHYWTGEGLHQSLQEHIYYFTDRDFRNSDDEWVKEVIRLYDSGYRVPTENAIRVLENGTVQLFNFKEVITPSATQNVFAFNITTPNATVKKEVVTKDIYSGSTVDFNITVKNIGEGNLTKLFINETDFSNGLKYKSFKSPFNWTYDKENKIWILNDTLKVNDTAYIILTFDVNDYGNMNNNVTVGIGNYSFNNSFVNFTVKNPNMTIQKISNNKTVNIGELTSFTIVVKNTGDCNLTGVYVVDNGVSGLVYDYFVDESGMWTFKGDGKWIYNDVLVVNQSANFTIFFKALSEGFLNNTAITGHNLTNKTVNSTNNTTVKINPNITIQKISNNKTVKIGELTSFTIVVKNTGDCNLTGVYVIDKGASGLAYDHFVDESGMWTFKGDGKWIYNDVLVVNQSANFTIFFKALSEGFLVNTAIAGHNLTNKTVNSTNDTTVEIIKNNTTNETVDINSTHDVNNTVVNDTVEKSEVEDVKSLKFDSKATGNPIFALLMVLIALGCTLRRKK